MANTRNETKTTVAERRRAAREQAQRRQKNIFNALDSELSEEARDALTTALNNLASEYSYTVNYAIEEAERVMLDSLRNLAKTWGWTLVDTAGEDAHIELNNPVAKCASDASNFSHTYDAFYNADDEFHALDTHVEAANLRHPPKEQTV